MTNSTAHDRPTLLERLRRVEAKSDPLNHGLTYWPHANPDGPEAAEAITGLLADLKAARAALEGMTEHYAALANSGDCGFWNPEEEAVVIEARATLAAMTTTDQMKKGERADV